MSGLVSLGGAAGTSPTSAPLNAADFSWASHPEGTRGFALAFPLENPHFKVGGAGIGEEGGLPSRPPTLARTDGNPA